MNILVTGSTGQLKNKMRIINKEGIDKYIFTDITTRRCRDQYFDITDFEAIREIVAEYLVNAIVTILSTTQRLLH